MIILVVGAYISRETRYNSLQWTQAIINMVSEQDIEFILSHFESDLFPRKMMTSISNGQFTVYSEEEIFDRCKQSGFLDCRINAYPECTKWENHGLVRYPPNFLFFDLDLTSFIKYKDPKKMLDRTLKDTLNRISVSFLKHSQSSRHSSQRMNDNGQINLDPMDIKPTALWTGNGYHIYLPIDAVILDQENYFSKDGFPSLFLTMGKYSNWSVSEVFLKYAEIFFTNGKADPLHKPKYKTCLIRIPGSYNSKLIKKGLEKEESVVKVIQKWNGKRIPIQLFLKDFRRWITQEEYNQKLIIKKRMYCRPAKRLFNTYAWIENLLQTPLEDHRRYCIFHILVPYLVNVKRLSAEEVSRIIIDWLSKCGRVRSLDFDLSTEINNHIKYVKKYKPMGHLKLKEENPELYKIMFD